MKGNIRRLRGRLGKKAWLTVPVVIAAACLLGGGAYALLGGAVHQSASGEVDLQKGLVGWWKLDGNAHDSTPYRNDGTMTGATWTPDRKGQADDALNFPGSPNNVQIPNSAVLNPANAITISTWFLANAVPTGSTVDRFVANTQSGGYALYQSGATSGNACGTSNICFQIRLNGSYQYLSTPRSALTEGDWYLVTATYDGTYMKLYVDGNLVATSPAYSGPIDSSPAPLCLGAAPSATACDSNYLNGASLDDVRIYNRALSSTEVAALHDQYSSGVQAASGEKGLIGWWKLDGNTKDSTPYHSDMSLGGSTVPTLTTDRKGTANSAYNFDGTVNTGGYLVGSTDDRYDTDVNVSRSYSIWFMAPNTFGHVGNLMYKSASCIGWSMQMNGNGTLSYNLNTGTNGCTGYTSYAVSMPGSYADGIWHLATVVIDRPNSQMYFYVDGSLKNSAAIDNTVSGLNTGTLRLGSSYNDSTPFEGKLDDARIYNRVLSASEIANLFSSYHSQINLNSSPTATTNTGNINQGLIGYWNFNDNTHDSTPYRDNGTVTGATWTSDHKGTANSALAFAGNPDNVTVPFASILTPTSALSIGAWFQANTNTLTGAQAQRIMSDLTSNDGYGLIVTGPTSTDPCGTSVLCFRTRISGTVQSVTTPISNLTDGTWYHVVGTFDGTYLRLYVNGSLVSTSANVAGTITTSSGPLCIGADPSGGTCSGNYLKGGSIDEVRIYDRALSTSEVRSLYQAAD